jgi:hypothetical protein
MKGTHNSEKLSVECWKGANQIRMSPLKRSGTRQSTSHTAVRLKNDYKLMNVPHNSEKPTVQCRKAENQIPR